MENRPALVDYAAPIVGLRASAEDAVQEAYFRFVPPPGPPADIGSPASYLFRIVRNIAIDMTRRVSSEVRRDAQFAHAADGAVVTVETSDPHYKTIAVPVRMATGPETGVGGGGWPPADTALPAAAPLRPVGA